MVFFLGSAFTQCILYEFSMASADPDLSRSAMVVEKSKLIALTLLFQVPLLAGIKYVFNQTVNIDVPVQHPLFSLPTCWVYSSHQYQLPKFRTYLE